MKWILTLGYFPNPTKGISVVSARNSLHTKDFLMGGNIGTGRDSLPEGLHWRHNGTYRVAGVEGGRLGGSGKGNVRVVT